jgi:hypothetical protein
MKRRDFTSLLTLSTLGFGMTTLKDLSNWGATLTPTHTIPALFTNERHRRKSIRCRI